MALSGSCLGPDSPKYSPILPKFSPNVVIKQTKSLFESFSKDLSLGSKHFWSNFDPEDTNYCGETSAVGLLKYIKIKALSLLSFPLCGLFLPGNRVRSQLKAVESKFDKNLFYPHNSCQLPVKKFWFQHFPVLGLYITKDISEKV